MPALKSKCRSPPLMVTDPATADAPALLKSTSLESLSELMLMALVTIGSAKGPPVGATTTSEVVVGTPALQSPGMVQLAEPPVQLSVAMVAPLDVTTTDVAGAAGGHRHVERCCSRSHDGRTGQNPPRPPNGSLSHWISDTGAGRLPAVTRTTVSALTRSGLALAMRSVAAIATRLKRSKSPASKPTKFLDRRRTERAAQPIALADGCRSFEKCFSAACVTSRRLFPGRLQFLRSSRRSTVGSPGALPRVLD